MFGIGSTELLLILVVALVVLGPRSLAGFARSLGKLMGEFRRVSTEFQRSLNVETARAEAREAEAERKASQAAENLNKPTFEKDVQASEQAHNSAGMADLPADSPVARQLAKARAEAQAAMQDINKVERELGESAPPNDGSGREKGSERGE